MTLQSLGELDRFQARGGYAPGYPPNMRRFFAPEDNLHGVLIEVVSKATISIAAAIYGYDDEELDQLFRNAWQKESLPVQICLDKTQAAGAHEKAILAAWPADQIGNRIVVGQSRKHAINHLKLIVVDGLYTIGGSTNLSMGGEQKQNNELIIVQDAVYAAEARAKIDMTHSEMEQQMTHAG
jgi:phosphatidylserine/phosphatidylglycerophosphate/cardiolipin synthase-like enzyme